MHDLAPDDVVITGIGMQTSLGDAVTSCAAARAGISLARELDDFAILLEDGNERGVVGHAVDAVAGFRGQGKLFALAWGALRDLLDNNPSLVSASDGLGIVLCAPEMAADEEQGIAEWTAKSLASRLAAHVGLRVVDENCQGVSDQGVGFAAGLAWAVESLRSARLKRCIVGAVDSLLEHDVVSWLDLQRRLKTVDRPDGLSPSEGAAFLLLERRDAAARGQDALVTLRACSIADPRCVDAGSAMASAISSLLVATGPLASGVWLVSDHNGESVSASDLGNGLSRLRRDHAIPPNAPIWFPAGSFGDAAAVNGALGMCVAARALGRGYAPASSVVATFANDAPRAAVRMEKT